MLWRGSGEDLAVLWRGSGHALERLWRGSGEALAMLCRGSGEAPERFWHHQHSSVVFPFANRIEACIEASPTFVTISALRA